MKSASFQIFAIYIFFGQTALELDHSFVGFDFTLYQDISLGDKAIVVWFTNSRLLFISSSLFFLIPRHTRVVTIGGFLIGRCFRPRLFGTDRSILKILCWLSIEVDLLSVFGPV